jgi:hypothetical protein
MAPSPRTIAALALLACAAPAAAQATRRSPSPQAASPRTAPPAASLQAAPQRTTPPASTALVAPAAPAPARASALAAPAPTSLFGASWHGTVLVGIDRLSGETGLAARVDLDTDLVPLGARGMLSAVLSAGYARFSSSDKRDLGFGMSTTTESSANVLDLVPAFRATLDVRPGVALHADAGLGLSYTSGSASVKTVTPAGALSKSADASGMGSLLRFAVGGSFDLNPRASLGAELGLSPRYGETRGTSVTVLAAASYRL